MDERNNGMSGFCSAHMGHDPTCSTCASSSPEEAQRSQEYAEAFGRGFERGAEAVAEWLEGAQWKSNGQPCSSDALLVVEDGKARELAGMVRRRFVGTTTSSSPEASVVHTRCSAAHAGDGPRPR